MCKAQKYYEQILGMNLKSFSKLGLIKLAGRFNIKIDKNAKRNEIAKQLREHCKEKLVHSKTHTGMCERIEEEIGMAFPELRR